MIRLTFVSNSVRTAPEEYDTDHLGEALGQAIAKWFASGDGPHIKRPWTFAVVVERDGQRISKAEVAEELSDIAAMERARSLD